MRELENVVVRLVTLVEPETIAAADVEHQLRPASRRDGRGPATLDLETLERWAVVEALRRQAGNRANAAAELGIAIKTLYNKIRHHAIAPAEWGSEAL